MTIPGVLLLCATIAASVLISSPAEVVTVGVLALVLIALGGWQVSSDEGG